MSEFSEVFSDMQREREIDAATETYKREARLMANLAGLREAAAEMLADHMTSAQHHPGYVLVPVSAFNKLKAALANRAATVSLTGEQGSARSGEEPLPSSVSPVGEGKE